MKEIFKHKVRLSQDDLKLGGLIESDSDPEPDEAMQASFNRVPTSPAFEWEPLRAAEPEFSEPFDPFKDYEPVSPPYDYENLICNL